MISFIEDDVYLTRTKTFIHSFFSVSSNDHSIYPCYSRNSSLSQFKRIRFWTEKCEVWLWWWIGNWCLTNIKTAPEPKESKIYDLKARQSFVENVRQVSFYIKPKENLSLLFAKILINFWNKPVKDINYRIFSSEI